MVAIASIIVIVIALAVCLPSAFPMHRSIALSGGAPRCVDRRFDRDRFGVESRDIFVLVS